RPLVAAALEKVGGKVDGATLDALVDGILPAIPTPSPSNVDYLGGWLEALEKWPLDSRLAAKVESEFKAVTDVQLASALNSARNKANAFDGATKSVNEAIEKLEKLFMTGDRGLYRDFTAARIRYS